MLERSRYAIAMNKLTTTRRSQVVAALVEGNSVRATCRMTGVDKGAVLKLLVDLGAACERYQDATLRNLKLKRIQCDEIREFVYAKAKNLPEPLRGAWATCGPGLRWTRIRSSCLRGASGAVTPSPATPSSAIWHPGWRIGSR